ncbi:MAG: HEAT repeat domain-containing protein, partial [Candidatus Hodarchaeales archaeon]
MLTENIAKDLLSNDSEKQNKALDLCLLNINILATDSTVLNNVFQLLGHSEYRIRQKTENFLKFFFLNNPDHFNLIYNYIDEILMTKQSDNETWYRFSRLIAHVSKGVDFKIQPIVEILNSEGYSQCLAVFLLREISELDVNLLVNELLRLLSTEDNSIQAPDSFSNNADNKTDLKKAICWIFWHNNRLISLKSLELLSIFSIDEDREVRRLSCETLIPILKDEEFQTVILEILVDRLSDSSRRVQRIAIENLLSIALYIPQEKLFFIERIIDLFSHEDWRIRKNICETLPPNSLIQSYGTKTKPFLRNLILMLDDPRWEVREAAALTLNQNLTLTKKENKKILLRIFNLMNDPHEQVRKTSCNIISHNFHANLNLKSQFFGKVVSLIIDKSSIVREEALNCVSTVSITKNWISSFPDLLTYLFRVMEDKNKNVRIKAWKLLNKLTENLSEPYLQVVMVKTSSLSNSSDAKIRYFSLTFFKSLLSTPRTKKSLIYTAPYMLSWKQQVLVLLKDKEATVSEIAWQIVLENKTIFIDTKKDLRNIFLDLNVLSPQICQHSCDICIEFGWIENDSSIRDILINLLCKTNNREVKKSILNAFLPFKEKFYLSDQILFQLIHDGQWDVQERVCQFLIPLSNEKINSPDFHEFLNEIIVLLGDPIKKFYSSSSKQVNLIPTLTRDLKNILSEKNLPSLFDDSNDDIRFKKWLQLEEKFDLVKKINHPDSLMIIEQFNTIITNQITHMKKDLGYHEFFKDKIDLNTPIKIINLMRKQQEFVRLSLLKNIELLINFSQKKNEPLRKAILYSL